MHSLDLPRQVLVAGMLGAMMTFLFSAWTIMAVGDVAQKV